MLNIASRLPSSMTVNSRVYPVISMTGHDFVSTNPKNIALYKNGISVDFDAARAGALSKHNFIDVTMTVIDIEVAGGCKWKVFFLLLLTQC